MKHSWTHPKQNKSHDIPEIKYNKIPNIFLKITSAEVHQLYTFQSATLITVQGAFCLYTVAMLQTPLLSWAGTVSQSIMCILLIRLHLHSWSPPGAPFHCLPKWEIKVVYSTAFWHHSEATLSTVLSCSSSMDTEDQGWGAPFRTTTTSERFTHNPLLWIAQRLCGCGLDLPSNG